MIAGHLDTVGFPGANAGDSRNTGSIPGLGRSPGGGNGNPLKCSYLGNPRDRGAWWATDQRVAKRRTWLKQVSTHPSSWREPQNWRLWNYLPSVRNRDTITSLKLVNGLFGVLHAYFCLRVILDCVDVWKRKANEENLMKTSLTDHALITCLIIHWSRDLGYLEPEIELVCRARNSWSTR